MVSSPSSARRAKSRLFQRLTLSQIDYVKSKMQKCWSVPAGARDAKDLVVIVRISLTPDGGLRGAPELVNTERLGEEYFRVAAESALRAIRRCAPYELPQASYEQWREMELKFDPREMFRG